MEKRTIRTGLVGALSEDFDGLQEALTANLKKRFRMICERPGYRYDDEVPLSLTYKQLAGSFIVKITGMGMVLFRDYDIYTPEDGLETISTGITIDPDDIMYVMVRRVRTESAPGTYNAGYPVDGGKDTLETVTATIAIEDELLNDDDNYPLYKIQRIGDTIEIDADYRNNYNIVLISELPQNAEALAVSNLQAELVRVADAQEELSVSQQQKDNQSKNTLSTRLNSLRSGTMLVISWDAVDYDIGIWGYDVQIHSGAVEFMQFVPAVPGLTTRELYIQVPENKEHAISIRSISRNPSREHSEWANVTVPIPLGYSMVSPSIESAYIVTQFPTVVKIVPSLYSGQAALMHVKMTVQEGGLTSVIDYEEICYSGVWGPVNLPLPPTGTVQFRIKAVHEDSTSSVWSDPTVSFSPNTPILPGEGTPEVLTFCVPVDGEIIDPTGLTTPGTISRHLLRFVPPASDEVYQITGASFRSFGTALNILGAKWEEYYDLIFKIRLSGQGDGSTLVTAVIDQDWVGSVNDAIWGWAANQSPSGPGAYTYFVESELSDPITLIPGSLYELFVETVFDASSCHIITHGVLTLFLTKSSYQGGPSE